MGPIYPAARTSLLTHEDNELLAELANGSRCSAAEVARRLIRAEAKRMVRRQRAEERAAANRVEVG
jgi:hypothetical protein